VLRQIADGVLIHQSEFVQSNAVVVQGRAGVLLIDPGVPAAPPLPKRSGRARAGRLASPSGYRRTSPRRYRGTCSASCSLMS
jgi:hypothetical protein